MSTCEQVHDELAELVDNDHDAIARHAEHLAGCDACRDARHEAAQLANLVARAGSDHVPAADLVERVLAAVDREVQARPQIAPMTSAAITEKPAVVTEKPPARQAPAPRALEERRRRPSRVWLAVGATAAIAAGGVGIYAFRGQDPDEMPRPSSIDAAGAIGKVTTIARAAADGDDGVSVRSGTRWHPLHKGEMLRAGAEVRTDERTRVALELADGTKLVLDHATTLGFEPNQARRLRLTSGRLVADVAHIDGQPAAITTPSGVIDVVGTRFVATATDTLTSVQIVRGAVVLRTTNGDHDEVHAGEEGVIDHGALSIGAAPALASGLAWSELTPPAATAKDDSLAGLGALRAYKPGETRDRDWNLALAQHDVKVRIVGPIARTEITETFRNDTATTLEGVYQFPLPVDARIDGLALDMNGGFAEGAFVDKARGAKIWKGVIDKASPKPVQQLASNEIIWVDGRWTDPALLDWKRGGRFELKVYPIPAKGARTIKLSYTQVVTPRGPWRQYVYPLPHSQDGSTVADKLTVDVEVRGATPGLVHASGYPLTPDAARSEVNAMTMRQSGFVPRGDLVVEYRATDGDAELRAWTFAGGAAMAPDDKLAAKHNVGNDPKVIEAQRAAAADLRPAAVIALRPALPRWRESRPHDYLLVVDASQSMVGERFARASELVTALVDQMDRRDRFSILSCDSDCRRLGDLRAPSPTGAADTKKWLAAETPAGASDLVTALRTAANELAHGDDRERWIIYLGDGFASTGFRRVADIEKSISDATSGSNIHITTIGIGTDADSAVLSAAARGGGGSYLAWMPGESVGIAASSALQSTQGTVLRDATVELPAGLADVAPSVLPTIRAGEEVLIAARVSGAVAGDVIVRGTVGGQKFEQRYPIQLAVSSAAGNGFVPRLWASLAIDQLERRGGDGDRARVVALSQGYGVMSRETSLLVLESAAMFDAFGIDRRIQSARWTGDEQLDEVVSAGTMPVVNTTASTPSIGGSQAASAAPPMPSKAEKAPAQRRIDTGRDRGVDLDTVNDEAAAFGKGIGRSGLIAMRRTWVRVPAVSPYDGVNDAIKRAIATTDAALANSPDSREKHRALVQALAYAGEIDRARDVANRWLDRDKLDPQALGYQADLLGRDGQRELALRTLAGLVDLDADRPALHERMVRAYEVSGRLAQACGHRIALAALQPTEVAVSGAAIRCLRTLGRDRDADLIVRALPDDAARAAAEKAAMITPAATRIGGDLVIDARWAGGADLDLSLVTPEGTRVSWMGGRPDVMVADTTSGERERLAVRSLKRGNYLVEVTRGSLSIGPIRGTIDITVLGTKTSLPFELLGSRAVVGRIAVSLREQLEMVDDGVRAHLGFGAIANEGVRRVMLARAPQLRSCYLRELQGNPGARGVVVLSIQVENGGHTTTRANANGSGLELTARCLQQNLSNMHVEGSPAGALRVPLSFSTN